MNADRIYSGESVRHTISRLYGVHAGVPVKLPHATVPLITTELVNEHADMFDAILKCVREQVHNEQQKSKEVASNTIVTSHWLLSVPSSLWQSEEDVVNYLGMLVALDFCHWAEVLPAVKKEKTTEIEEGGILTTPGEEVTGFAGFYTVAEAGQGSTSTHQNGDHNAEGLFAEPKDITADKQRDGRTAILVRGSAAMMLLLRRAVVVHRVPWYDVDYLLQFHGDVDVALKAMQVCFMGCEKDGLTPLWMPCTRTRVQLLLSLADAFSVQRTSYYQLLRESAGYIFRPPMNTAAACAGVRGFVPSLVRFHPRYHDFAQECSSDVSYVSDSVNGDRTSYVPILKLSQLTALAVEQSLPELWRCRCSATTSAFASPSSSSSWMVEHAAEVVNCHNAGFFTDRAELSICCDYQIPKTLRAAGLLVYDAHLAQLVDHHVLLCPGSAEESSIRIATLVAAYRLLEYLETQENGHTSPSQGDASSSEATSARCRVNHLDYALWYIGRYMVSSTARHHLCRTIMY